MKRSIPASSSRRRTVFASVAAAAVLSVTSALGANITGFTNFTLNANADAQGDGVPQIVDPNTLRLTSNNDSQATSAFYNDVQSLTNWTATFQYAMGAASPAPADGFAFVVQNDPRGATALGDSGGAIGYVGGDATRITRSVAVGHDLYNGGHATITRTGTAANGGGFAYGDVGNGVTLRGTVNVSLAYRDGIITQTLQQGGNTFTRQYARDIPAYVGSTSGFVGFTGGTGGSTADQTISNFSFITGNAAATGVTPDALITGVPQGGAGTFGVREVLGAAGCCGNLTEARNAIIANAGTATANYQAPVINLFDSDTRGNFQNDSLYRTDPDQAGASTDTVNNVAVVATGRIRIPTSGVYTFGSNSDDGFRLTIAGQRFQTASGQGGTQVTLGGSLEFPSGRGGGEPSLGTITLAAGDYDIQMLNWEGGGGANVELYAAQGAHAGFNNNFNLVGAAAVPHVQEERRRFAGMVNTPITVARFNNPAGANGEARLNDISARLVAFRASGGTSGADSSGSYQLVNFNDLAQGGNPRTGGDIPAPVEPVGGDPAVGEDNYGLGAFGTLSIGAGDTGIFTFNVHADDDSIFRIFRPDGSLVPLISTNRTAADTNGDSVNDAHRYNGCCNDSLGQYDLNVIGDYIFEVAMQEGGGGSHFQLFGAKGAYGAYDPAAFQVVGQNIDTSTTVVLQQGRPEGLQLVGAVPEPGTFSVIGLAGLVALRRRGRRA